ncbi:MAG: DNA polymerase I 5'-3' exonuclease domain [uncultured Acidimicrobiales bacterium]|uniref:5'-3' exonuclease n=1 Tax=uncultured Acidimicrobiales bacterium TaxID=310071 RepID=A0A6J4HM50_9ACTN|nr:MAG: DNA polymerase I 5'-3' exonuclease domain [uncultured Acidimicrobiales bacterium]
MKAHLIDGTYELFRHHFGVPEEARQPGSNAAARGVLWTVYYLLEEGATHVGVATDQVIESFRNEMWPGYKTGEGIDPVLLAQFPVLEDGLEAMGVKVWAMRELEADDALASAAAVLAERDEVEQIVIMTPDKDLGQCVLDGRIVQYDRRKQAFLDEEAIRVKFGVEPHSIPDYLALVGDSADGFPGLPGWGAKSAAAVLARYHHLEDIPDAPGRWDVTVRGGAKLAATLAANRELALLFRDIATLRIDRSLVPSVDSIRWQGPTDGFAELCERIDANQLAPRAAALAAARRTI